MTQSNHPLWARAPGGGTPALDDWGVDSEYGTLREGPARAGRELPLDGGQRGLQPIVRDTPRKGYRFDKQRAVRQYRELVEAYEDAGVHCMALPLHRDPGWGESKCSGGLRPLRWPRSPAGGSKKFLTGRGSRRKNREVLVESSPWG